MTSPSFDHVGLSVADLDAQRRFYRAAFGFAEEHHAELGAARVALLRDPGGAAIELTESAGSTPQRFTGPVEGAGVQGYFHWALAVPDLDEAIAAVVACGGTAVSPPADAARPGTRFAYVADPEGNLVELIRS